MAENIEREKSSTGQGMGGEMQPSFFDVNYNQTDSGLSHEQKKEWDAIYASYRSNTPLNGIIVGVDTHQGSNSQSILCLVLMEFRVKVMIPQTEIWLDETITVPDYVIRKMIGARIDYIITHVDRIGECAVASRRLALAYKRSRFFRNRMNNEIGSLQTCNILSVGPSKILLECNGFDFQLRNRDLTYTAIADLREEYRPGQTLQAKLLSADQEQGTIQISVKEVNPNPFDGADKRHPVGSTRKAVISGTYAGGVFCRLSDDTTCLCLYSPNYFSDSLFINDAVLIAITQYNYEKKQIFGKIISKI